MQCEPFGYLRLQTSAMEPASMSMSGVDPTVLAWLCNMTDSSPFVARGFIVHDLCEFSEIYTE